MAVMVLIVAIVAIMAPNVRRSASDSVSSLVGKVIYHYSLISVYKADATGNEVAGHEAANVFQGDTSSFWAAPAPKPGTKTRVRLIFDRPHDVALLRITTGDPANSQANPRPSMIEYQFSDGKTHPILKLENVDTKQSFKVSAVRVTFVDFIIDDVYKVAGSSFYSAVYRIEVFEKKAGK